MKEVLVAVVTCAMAQGTCAAADKNTCGQAVFSAYIKQDTALLMSAAALPIKSVSVVIAQRRLQESFCLQFVTCSLGNDIDSLPFRAEFSKCLDDEAKEQQSN